MLISSVQAQESGAAAAAPQQDIIGNMLPLVLIVVVFYFLLIRPQQKRFKEHQQMIEGLRRGDKVVTGGGMIGTVKKVDTENKIVQVEIAEDTVVQVMRDSVTNVLNRTEPADAKDGKKPGKDKKKKAGTSAAND
ncbi:MAG: preprotein translocase subunit YajC [Alphaproteobacteria bacterium]|nr:preprotein translocase subunit YajC [Alphaproteobacteria bacterium]